MINIGWEPLQLLRSAVEDKVMRGSNNHAVGIFLAIKRTADNDALMPCNLLDGLVSLPPCGLSVGLINWYSVAFLVLYRISL